MDPLVGKSKEEGDGRTKRPRTRESDRLLEFQSFQGEQQDHHQPHNTMASTSHSLDASPTNQGFMFASANPSSCPPPILPWSIPSIDHGLIPLSSHDRQYFPLPPPPPPPPIFPPHHPLYGDLYGRRAVQLAYGGEDGIGPLGLSGLYGYAGQEALVRGGGFGSGLHAEFGKLSAQEVMDAKALAASKSHSEAERRRRERINAHLARLRSLLPSTTKTDKASLLAEVIQHVKELKRQTSEIAEESPLPTESDELTVDATNDEEGRLVVRASLCCDDRADLLPDLIKALKSLRLRALKAEITTLGGRVKNVLVITGEESPDDEEAPPQPQQCSIASIQDALKAVMERTASADEPSFASGSKRQRTANLSSILEHSSL